MALKSVTPGFRDSQEFALRKAVRDAVKGAAARHIFTKSERDITLVLVNMWFHHRNGPKGYIHPGRERIAKRANVSVWTVAKCLALLRETKALRVVGHARGEGQRPTQYLLDISALLDMCECGLPDVHPGVLSHFLACEITHHFAHTAGQSGVGKSHTDIINVSTPIQRGENVVLFPGKRGAA